MFPGRLARRVAVWEAAPVIELGSVLAHQGGWDEMLMVATPIAIFVVLLRIANARAAKAAAEEARAGVPCATRPQKDDG